jgi:hypothetical protein
VSRDDESDLRKEVVQLRLELHHEKNKTERLQAVLNYYTIEARDFEAKWLRVLEENEQLRKEMKENSEDLCAVNRVVRKELQDTREDLDRVNEVLAKLFKTRA